MGEHEQFNDIFCYGSYGNVIHGVNLDPIDDCTVTTGNSYPIGINSSDTRTITANNIYATSISSSYPCTTVKNGSEISLNLNNCHDALHNFHDSMSTMFAEVESNWKDICELIAKEILNDNEGEEAMDLHPVKIIFNDPVSVVFWEDGEKTVVRRHEGEPYDKYTAFCAALAIKIFGSNTEVNRIVRGGIDQQEKDRKKAEKKAEKIIRKAQKNG